MLALIVIHGANVGSQQPQPAPGRPFRAGELLVAFEPWTSDALRAAIRARLGAGQLRAIRNALDGRIELTRLPAGVSVEAAIAALANVAGVQYAEPNWVYTHDAESNDPAYTGGYLWGMQGDASTPANQFGSQAAEAWTAGFTGSSGVYVAVIDEGIDFNHPDLSANIWTNPFDPVDGVDNDNNGFIDDVHGWDFFSNNNSVFDGGPGSSVDSHGTHVAGTIGASGGNGAGVVGVNWNVRIISAKFLGPQGGSTADAVEALDYITDLKTRHGLNIIATNNSWGGGGFSQALLDAITRAAKADILFMAAAGNGNAAGVGLNNDTTPNYPSNYNTTQGSFTEPAASYDSVIAVASLTNTGARSTFSNFGRTTVDLGAPGSAVWSTTPNNTYSNFSGTSMATPHVTGAAALYASMQVVTSATQIKQAILDSATATPTASLATNTVTGGRLNISRFLTGTVPSPPAAPTNLIASAVSASQINLTWSDQSSNETGFRVERCTGATCTTFTQVASLSANTTSYQNMSLAANTTYRYRVVAFNDGGSSPSGIAAATTMPAATIPARPTGLVATPGPGAGRITLTWSDNSGNETGFRIYRCGPNVCGSGTQVGEVGANVTTFADVVTSGARYWYGVVSFNGAGQSAASNSATAVAP
jgi:subtilisin family serine protease